MIFLHTTPAFDALFRGVLTPRLNSAISFDKEKLKWWGYSTVKEVWEYVYSFRNKSRAWQTPSQPPR